MKPPPNAKRHFRDMHSGWPLRARNELVRHIDQMCLASPDSIACPQKDAARLRWLPLYDGWNCFRCEFCYVSEASMEHHAREAHQWTKGHSKIWRAAQVQTFFSGTLRRFFEVEYRRDG
jgi:hypothetical protein